MYLSKLFIPITKDLPTEAKIKSHQLMLRIGMISSPLQDIFLASIRFKIMKKIEQIVRRTKCYRRAKNVNANYSIIRNMEREWKIR